MAGRTAVEYILEIEENGRPIRSFAIPPVATVEIVKQPATSRRWTFGDSPVKQKSGYRQARISISGVSGNRPRRGTGNNGTGDAIFREYIDFLSDYEANGADNEGPIKRDKGKRQRLVFRSIKRTSSDAPNSDTFAYYVEVERAPQSHNTDNLRMQWGYQLALVTEGDVNRGNPVPYGTPAQQTTASTFTRGVIDSITNSVYTPDPASGVSSLVPSDALANTGVRYGSLDELQRELPIRFAQFRQPIRWFIEQANTAKQIGGVIRSVFALPRNVITDIADAASTSVEVLESLWDAIPGPERAEAREWFNRAYAGIEAARVSAITELGLSNRKLPGRGALPGTSVTNGVQARNGQTVQSAEMVGDETLTQFCYRVLGDPSRFDEVMDLNDMASPFEAANGVPLGAGMSLIIPATTGFSQTPRDNRDLFGVDILIVDGDLVMAGTTDIALVRERPNLEQALVRRLLAEQGENQAFPEWGMPRLVGEPALAGTAGYIASQVREQIESDSRVRRVEDVVVLDGGDTFDAQFSIVTVDGQVTQVIAPIPA